MVTLDAVEDEVVLPALVQLVDLLRHLLDARLDAVHPVGQLISLHGQLRRRRGSTLIDGLLEPYVICISLALKCRSRSPISMN